MIGNNYYRFVSNVFRFFIYVCEVVIFEGNY